MVLDKYYTNYAQNKQCIRKISYHYFVMYFSFNLDMNTLQSTESRFRYLKNYSVQQIFHKITEDAAAN